MSAYRPPTHTAVKRKNVEVDSEKVAKKLALENHSTLIIQFTTEAGEVTGSPLELPKDITPQQLTDLINSLLTHDERIPYAFYLNEQEITESLQDIVSKQDVSIESTLTIVYRPQALFRVNAVARCTSSLPGHTEAILHTAFSADGKHLATGSGDCTVRLWDVNTETPKSTLKGHSNWVMSVAWSPCGRKLASGGMDKEIRIWDPFTGQLIGKPLKGHTQGVTALAWEPLKDDPTSTRLASASKDGTVRLWDTKRSLCIVSFSGHSKPIRCLKWGGEGCLYSGSQDRTIKVWDVATFKLVRTLEGHAHWVNSLSTNTEYALRTGHYNHLGQGPKTDSEIKEVSKEKYDAITKGNGELLVSCSDDFTLYLWKPSVSSKPIFRMTGHQQPVNFVQFSPDGSMIASASFDKSIRLWNGLTGKFISVFRAHVQSVYQVAWSADSRLLASSSKDSTIKLWSIAKKKMIEELPGHADEVYAVDWSPDGERLATGGKDKILKVWRS